MLPILSNDDAGVKNFILGKGIMFVANFFIELFKLQGNLKLEVIPVIKLETNLLR